jgi:preprotein translocase subunit SecD
MPRFACLLAALLFIGACAPAWGQDKVPDSSRKLPNGVYAVLRSSLKEKDVRPLKDGERLLIHRHRYLKTKDKVPPSFLVVRAAPDVDLDLAGPPKAEKEGEEVVRILLKLKPKAAKALERLTSGRDGKPIAIVLGGEVVTMHKVRAVIKGGDLQITSCAAGAAKYLLEQLNAQSGSHRPGVKAAGRS